MSERRTYMDRVRAGESGDVDAEIKAWVESDFAGPLYEWLGMSVAEYEAFTQQRMYGPDTVRDK